MTRDEIFERVHDEAVRVLHIDGRAITDEVRFKDLMADSLDLIEILVPIEEALAIDVPQGGLDDVTTVGEFVDLVFASCNR